MAANSKLAPPGHGSVAVSSVSASMGEVCQSLCGVVYDYWRKAKGDAFAPTWAAFDLPDLPGNCVRCIHVVDVHQDPFDITFRFWGTGLTDVLYFDRTGQSLLSTDMGYLNEDRRTQVLADYRAVIDTRAPYPFLWDAASTGARPRRLIVPTLRLPLSDDGARVSHVVTHFDFTDTRSIWEEMFRVAERDQPAVPPSDNDSSS